MDTLSAGTGPLAVSASLQTIGADMLIAVWGGTQPHIGALAVATPHPDPAIEHQRSSTVLQFSFPGHRDEVIARRVAERVASALKRTVAVSAGFHVPDITPDGIKAVLANTDMLIENIIGTVRSTNHD
jgi:gallate decarboxylase subunit D